MPELSKTEIVEKFISIVYEADLYRLGLDDLHVVHNNIQQMKQQVELITDRMDQEALNRFSLCLAESAVKRMEFGQLTQQNQLHQAKFYLQLFSSFAIYSKRFRDTIHRSHNIHLWLSMLRCGVQLEALILSDVFTCILSSIADINTAFSMEYVYWKRFIPELIDMVIGYSRKYPFQMMGDDLINMFDELLSKDFTFLAHAYSQLGRKDFTQLIHITITVTESREIEWSNYEFCDRLSTKLKVELAEMAKVKDQDCTQDRVKIHKLVQLLDRVVKNRVHRVEVTQGSDEDEEEGEALQAEEEQADDDVEDEEDEEEASDEDNLDMDTGLSAQDMERLATNGRGQEHKPN